MSDPAARGAHRRLRFGGYEFDPAHTELYRHGMPVSLTAQTALLLGYLVDHRDRTVPRDELLDAVWGGVAVSDGALATAMYELRAALGDDGRRQDVIRTVRGRGFRFVASVEGGEAPAAAVCTPPGADAASTAPFVGRTLLLRRLHTALHDAARGSGRLVLLEGEAGMGKTSLAQRFACDAAGAARVLWGRCYEHAGAPPLWPWMPVLRALVRETPVSELRRIFGMRGEALAAALPELRPVFPRARDRTASAAEERFQLFDGIATLVRTASRNTPLLVVLDDLHWADEPSLLLLEFLAAETARTRCVLVCTYRSEEVPRAHPLGATLAAIARHGHGARLRLDGLAPQEVHELMTALAGSAPQAADVAGILRRTEGNPLFVTELARQLHEPADPAGRGAGASLPHPVQDVIRRRIDRLSPATQRALEVAAVIGRDFRLDVLARTWDGSTPLGAALDEAASARIVTVGGGQGRFAHALFHEALYARIGPSRTGVLHRRTGEALEAMLLAPGGADLAVMAHHFALALPAGGAPAKAVRYGLAAAHAASALLAYEEAVQYARRAVDALGWERDPAAGSVADVLLTLAEAEDQAGDAAAAREHFAAAMQAARTAGSAALLARAVLGWVGARDQILPLDGDAREAARRGTAAALLSEALAALGDGEPGLRARLMAALAAADAARDAAARDALSRAALAAAARCAQPRVLAEVVEARRELLWSPDNIDERLDLSTQIVALAQRTEAREHELRGRAWRLTDLLELGRVAQVQVEIETCDRLAAEIGQLKYRHLVAVLRATLAFLDGRFPDAERLADDARAVGRRMRCEVAELIHLIHLTSIRREQGGLASCTDTLRAIVARHPLHAVHCMLAYELGEMGCDGEARARYEVLAAHDFADVPRDRNFLAALMLLANLAYRFGDRRRAAALYALMLPFAERNVVAAEGVIALGSVSHPLGMLATTLARWDDAERHFEAAIALDDRIGARALVGQAECAFGEMLLARRHPGDHERGLAMLERACRTADRFGSDGLRGRVLAVRARAPRAPAPVRAASGR